MKTHYIEIAKTARYYVLGKPSKKIKNVWFLCHGYSQLAERFLTQFESLDDGENLLVAPEGLHRLYLEGMSGKVGASWMTREDRNNDIIDYVKYLDQVYEEVMLDPLIENVNINVLGFSQGTATVCRWMTMGKSSATRIFLWAGAVPDDLNFEKDVSKLNKLKPVILLGRQDEYITEDDLKKHLVFLEKVNMNYDLIMYEGMHRIDPSTLQELAELTY
ncbi:MAG: phospholipase [Bacteroidetes bacterium]|nr:MAG: phospholipase [Bacteroidota bacterium]